MAKPRITWLVAPRGKGRPKADDTSTPLAENVVDPLSPDEITRLRDCIVALPCVDPLTQLQQDRLVDGLSQALPLYAATRGANIIARQNVKGRKLRLHRAHLLNDVSNIWDNVTGQAGTLWVKRRKGKPLLASPTVQIAKAAAKVVGDDLSLSAWRSQVALAENAIRRPRPPTLGKPRNVISLKD